MLDALFEVYFRVLKAATACPLITAGDATAVLGAPGSTGAATGDSPRPLPPPAQGAGSEERKKRRKGGKRPDDHAPFVNGGGSHFEWEVRGAQQLPGGPAAPPLGVARPRLAAQLPLLPAALQGLSRHAHLISVEYFADIFAVFQEVGGGKDWDK
jgi:hypothetical protein